MAKDTLNQVLSVEEDRQLYLGEIWSIWRKVLIPFVMLSIGVLTYYLTSSQLTVGIVVGFLLGPLIAGDRLIIAWLKHRKSEQH